MTGYERHGDDPDVRRAGRDPDLEDLRVGEGAHEAALAGGEGDLGGGGDLGGDWADLRDEEAGADDERLG